MVAGLLSVFLLFAPMSGSQDIPWSPFEWTGRSFGDTTFARVALMVPVRLQGRSEVFRMQLDTGCNVSMVYETPFEDLRYRARPVEGRESFVSLGGAVGGFSFDSFPFLVYEDFGSPLKEQGEHPLIGTVGLDMLVGKVLVLDYPNRRFCLVDSVAGELETLVSRAAFVDVQVRNDKLFLPLRIGGTDFEGFFFDTGTSMLPLTTRPDIWRRITHRSGEEADNVRIDVPSWGKKVTLVGAPVEGSVGIGALEVPNPLAYYASTGLVETEGIIGNALFYDENVIIIDLIHSRFGVLKSGAAD